MDFRSFLGTLREAGELIDIREPVSIDYEAGAICRQLFPSGCSTRARRN
jgi:3-polyprenyl-4-hydroxybenzoate decarboxylase